MVSARHSILAIVVLNVVLLYQLPVAQAQDTLRFTAHLGVDKIPFVVPKDSLRFISFWQHLNDQYDIYADSIHTYRVGPDTLIEVFAVRSSFTEGYVPLDLVVFKRTRGNTAVVLTDFDGRAGRMGLQTIVELQDKSLLVVASWIDEVDFYVRGYLIGPNGEGQYGLLDTLETEILYSPGDLREKALPSEDGVRINYLINSDNYVGYFDMKVDLVGKNLYRTPTDSVHVEGVWD